MGHKARVKRIDSRTAAQEGILRLIAATQASLAAQSVEHKEELREIRQLQVRATAASERLDQVIEDLRLTINQWNLRQEKMMREVLSETGEMIESLRESRREGVDEARAQRAALFAMIDELRGGGPAAA